MIKKLLNSSAKSRLAIGLIIFNFGAAIPFGISGGDGPLTDFEVVASVIFLTVAIALFFANNDRVLSWVATGSAGVWFGAAVGEIFDNYGDLSAQTIVLIILPIAIGFMSLALSAIAEVDYNRNLLNKKDIGKI